MSRITALVAVFVFVTSVSSQPTTQRTRQDSFEDTHQYKLAEGPEAYRLLGVKNPKWDDDAIRFLTMRAESQTYGTLGFMFRVPKLASDVEQRALGQKLLDAGCNDPQVLYQIARVCEKTAERRFGSKILLQAEKGIDASQYSAYRKYVIARYRLNLGEDAVQPAGRANSEARYLQCLTALLKDPSFRAQSRDVRWDALTEDFDEESRTDLCAAALKEVENDQGFDPWLYHSLAGRLEIRLAWKARGDGWASSVTSEGWQGFTEHLAKARDHLTQAWNLDNSQPQPAADMITVAMGEGDALNESIDTWLARATAAQFDFGPAYAKYRYAIQPKWGGSIRQLDQFATRCLNTQRFDSMVPHQLMQMVDDWYFQTKGEFDPAIVPGLPEKMLQCCDGYIEAGKARGLSINKVQSEKLGVLYSLKRFSEARALLDELKGNVDPDPLEHQFLWDVDVISEIHAMTGKHAAEITKVVDESTTQPPAEVLEHAKAILSSLPADAPEEHFVRALAADLEFSGKLATGDWIDLPTQNDLSQWKMIWGQWKLDPDGKITTHCQKNSACKMAFLPRLPKDYEINCTIDVSDDPDSNSYGQVCMAYGDATHNVYGAYSPLTKKVNIGSDYRARRSESCDASPTHYELLLRVRNGDQFRVTIDGKTSVFYEASSFVPGDRQRRLALSTNPHPTAVFSFSKIRIRTLPAEAQPDEKMKR